MAVEYKDVVDNIKYWVSEKGLKQSFVAKKAGFSESEFSNIINGRKLLRVEHLKPIADAIGITLNDLYKK